MLIENLIMRFKLILMFLLLAGNMCIFAQDPGYSYAKYYQGPLRKYADGDLYAGVIPLGIINNKIYMIGKHISEEYASGTARDIVVVDKKFDYYKSVTTLRPYEDIYLISIGTVFLNNRIFDFYSYYNKEHEKSYLFVDEFDTEKEEFKNEMKMILEVDRGFINNSGFVNFYFALSPDSSKLVVINTVNRKDGNVQDFGLSLFDSDMQLVSEVKSPLGKGNWAYIDDFIVDNDNQFYAKCYNDDGLKYVDYHFMHVDLKTGDVKYININPTEKKIYRLSMGRNNKNKILFVGLYNEGDMKNPYGMVSFSYQPEKRTIKEVDSKPFSKDFILAVSDKKGVSKFGKMKDYTDYFLEYGNMTVKDDNGFIFSIEQKLNGGGAVMTTGSGMSYSTLPNQNFGHIYVLDTDENGKINWCRAIKKYQVGGLMTNHCSYSVLHKNDKTYFIFKDSRKGLFNKSAIKGPLALVEVDANGDMRKETLRKKDVSDIKYYVRYGKMDNTFYMYGRKGLFNLCISSVTIGE